MNSGSSTAVTMAGTSVTIMARRASPTERNSAEQAMPSPSSTVEGRVMLRKPCASSSTRPSAPSRRRMGARNTQVRADMVSASAALITRLDVASPRASAMRCAPMARDTTAAIPISIPMNTDR